MAHSDVVTALALGYWVHMGLARATSRWCSGCEFLLMDWRSLAITGLTATRVSMCMRLFGVYLYNMRVNPSVHGEKYKMCTLGSLGPSRALILMGYKIGSYMVHMYWALSLT